MADVFNRRVVFVCSSMGASEIYHKDESVPIPSTCGDPDDEELSFKLLEDAENEDADTVTASMEVHESQVISQPVDDQMLFSLESWRFEEYIEAVRHGDFFRSVKNVFSQVGAREEPLLIEAPSDEERKEDEEQVDAETSKRADLMTKLIEEKYFVAGGSARLMFDYTMEGAIESIDLAMRKVPDFKRYLLELTGDGSPSAVNRILARYRGIDGFEEVRLVSSYVVRKFAKSLGPKLFLRFKEVCQVNPSVDGYLLEGWFFTSLGHSDLSIWYNEEDLKTKQLWENAEAIYCDPDKQTSLRSLKPTWLVPLKWRQGGYDAVFVDPVQKLDRFVQLTRGHKYSYKTEPFVSSSTEFCQHRKG